MSADNLFDFVEAQRLAVEGADRAHEAADGTWKAHARETILTVGRIMPTFTSDDVVRWCLNRSLPMPANGVAWGTVFRRLNADGLIEPTGEFRLCERTTRHSAPIRVWRLRVS